MGQGDRQSPAVAPTARDQRVGGCAGGVRAQQTAK